MASCELTGTCVFFNGLMARMPSMSSLFRRKYCLAEKEQCARYLVGRTLGSSAEVPADLLPNEWARAEDLLIGSRK